MLLNAVSGRQGMSDDAPQSMNLREALYVGALLSVLILAQLLLSHTLGLFSRMFWFDEVTTHILVTDPDPVRAARALWNGVDNNVPGLFLGLKAFTLLIGNTGESAFRAYAFVSVLAGLFGIYVLLRRCFTPIVAFTTVLTIWTHPLLLRHAFNARFYGPLFAASVWFAYLLCRAPATKHRTIYNVAIGASAVILCMTHYFGIISMFLVLFGELLHRRRLATARFIGFTAAAAGLIALAACTPLLASHLRNVTSTWVPPPSLFMVRRFAIELMLPQHLAIIPLVVWISYVRRMLRSRLELGEDVETKDVVSLSGLSALVLTPLIMTLFSYAAQPVLISQYAISTVAGLAPGIALVLTRVSRAPLIALCLFLLLIGAQRLRSEAARVRMADTQKLELIDIIRRSTGSHPVFFETYIVHEIAHYAPDLASRLFEVDEGDRVQLPSVIPNDMSEREWRTARAWDVGWTRRYAAIYGKPSVVTLDDLKALPTKYLVLGYDPLKPSTTRADTYFGYRLRHVQRNIYELVDPTRH